MDTTVTFTLEPADMKVFLVHWRRHSPYSKLLRRVMWTFVVLFSLLHAYFRYDDPVKRVLAFFLAIAIFSLTTWLAGLLMRRLVSRHMVDPAQQPGLYCEHTITLTESAVIEVTSINEGRHVWSGIHKVTEVPDYIYIFIRADMAHVIPKRAFPNASAASAFATRAQELWAAARPA
jgi:hypothetical protein